MTRKKRIEEWNKAVIVNKAAGMLCATCLKRNVELRWFPEGNGCMCFKHYVDGKRCSHINCDDAVVQRGLCREHYCGPWIPTEKSLYPKSSIAECERERIRFDFNVSEFDEQLLRKMRKNGWKCPTYKEGNSIF